jgi:uncharacterized protein (TIGR03083 family)
MNLTATAVADIAPLDHDEAMTLAETEHERLLDAVDSLRPEDWGRATDCEGWDVKAVLGHLLGMMERLADPAEVARQEAAAGERMKVTGETRIDALTALQVEDHQAKTPDELTAALRATAPRALAARRATTAEFRAATFDPGPPFDGPWTMGYAMDVIFTRDPWMHRVDLARATGAPLALTPDHDGRIVADVVAEWARRHGQAFTLVLTGPAGGTFVAGTDGERHELDAVEFCRILSGRGAGSGLLTTEVPF